MLAAEQHALQVGEVARVVALARRNGIELWNEAGQLRFRAPARGMNDDLLQQLRVHKDALLVALKGPQFRPGAPRERGPLLDFYQGYWGRIRAGQIHPSVVNATYFVAKLRGPLNIEALQSGIERMARRHQILASRVVAVEHGYEFVFGAPLLPIEIRELAGVEEFDRVAAARQAVDELIWAPFDVDGALLRVFAVRLSPLESIIGFVVHHFISDEASIRLLSRELIRDYDRFDAGRSPEPDDTPMQYVDYVIEMNAWLRSPNAALRLEYWKEKLRGARESRLRPDKSCDVVTVSDVATLDFAIEAAPVEALHRWCAGKQVTMFAVSVAAEMATLAYLNDMSDVVLITMHAGRDEPSLQNVVGAMMRRLPIRCEVAGSMSFQDLVKRVQAAHIEAAENLVPYRMIEPILPAIDAQNGFPLFNFSSASADSASCAGRWERFPTTAPTITGTAQRFSKHWNRVFHDGIRLYGQVGYSTLLYEHETCRRYLNLWCGVLRRASLDTSLSLDELLHAADCDAD